MSEKVIVITGANTGIGFQCALEMAKLKPEAIVIGCWNLQKASDAIVKIQKQGYAMVEFMKLDLDDLQSVQDFAIEI